MSQDDQRQEDALPWRFTTPPPVEMPPPMPLPPPVSPLPQPLTPMPGLEAPGPDAPAPDAPMFEAETLVAAPLRRQPRMRIDNERGYLLPPPNGPTWQDRQRRRRPLWVLAIIPIVVIGIAIHNSAGSSSSSSITPIVLPDNVFPSAPNFDIPSSFPLPSGAGPSADIVVPVRSGVPGDLIGATLTSYFDRVNAADYRAAYALLSAKQRSALSLPAFTATVMSTADSDFSVGGTTVESTGDVVVDLDFGSRQPAAEGPVGDTCDTWTLAFDMTRETGNVWRINGSQGIKGTAHTAC